MLIEKTSSYEKKYKEDVCILMLKKYVICVFLCQ